MKKTRGKTVAVAVVTLLILALLVGAPARASQQEMELFDSGYNAYLAYNPEKATDHFRAFLTAFPDSSLKDAALFWLGMSLVQLHSCEEAKNIFFVLEHEMPDSPFIPFSERERSACTMPGPRDTATDSVNEETNFIWRVLSEKNKAETMLSVISAERDALKAQLEEEQRRNRELQAKVNAFDAELREIVSRLQAIQSVPSRAETAETVPAEHTTEKSARQETHGEPKGAEREPVMAEQPAHDGEHARQPHSVQNTQPTQVHRAHLQPPSYTLEIIAGDDSWISVGIDDESPRSRLLKAGARIKWTARNGFSVKIGNAGGVRVLFNGKEIGPLGEKGKVVKLKLPSLYGSPLRQKIPDDL